MTVFEMSKRKSCCRSADWSERKRAKEEQKVLKSLERRDCFYCNCSHCSAFYRQVLAKHKIPYMRENRSTPSALTVQRQYHSRRSWKDEYGVKKGGEKWLPSLFNGGYLLLLICKMGFKA